MYNTFQPNSQKYVPLYGRTTGNSTVDTLLGAGLDQIGGLAPRPGEGQSIMDSINEANRAKAFRQVMLGGIQQHPVTQLLGGLTKGALAKRADELHPVGLTEDSSKLNGLKIKQPEGACLTIDPSLKITHKFPT